MTSFTVRVDDDLSQKLDTVAKKLARSRSYVAARAIEDYVAREAWAIGEIEHGIAQADSQAWAEPRVLQRVLATHGVKR